MRQHKGTVDITHHEGTVSSSRWQSPAQLRRIVVGEITVTYLPDGYVQLDPYKWFGLSPDTPLYSNNKRLISSNGYLIGSIGSLLVSNGTSSLLIDAGYGSRVLPAARSHPALGAMYGGNLKEFQSTLQKVDSVAFTHLHDDHSGWLDTNTDIGRSLRAKLHFASKSELLTSRRFLSKRWNTVESGTEFFPGVTALATPGHTQGHMSYLIESNGDKLLCFGDVMHSPLQVEHQYLNSCFEVAPQDSVSSRHSVIDFLADTGAVGAGMHFGDVVFGKIVRSGNSNYRWQPIP
ncbi:MBL fold metallo-hydrolase [Glutamicibacter mishrai]|uniref:MBL fold metallo-hydrolase n=1 Tax=Glutamicibacter mishrai TaxID=1775880 RepID=UPI0020CF969B|nr:MBL fold metallo-hydrolase [Glutamicibacter mishrai]UTT40450.1 MBL fold metallo-hydrolase [Glutamicibacter mishrai]